MIYYNVADDLRDFPEAVMYFIIGGNRTGKTYSTLKYCYESGLKFTFIKRTAIDVRLICSGVRARGTITESDHDFNPFKDINRDIGSNIHAASIDSQVGVGGFWDYDEAGTAKGAPIGYIVSLSQIMKLKGFSLSDSDLMVFDEFIPVKGEVVKKDEGDASLILYTLINNARELEDPPRPSLKMIALANAMQLNAPLLHTLNLTDRIAGMKERGESCLYMADRRILIRLLDDNEEYRSQAADRIGIFAATEGTRWKKTALDNEFAYDDFSQIRPQSVKGLRPIYTIKYDMINSMTAYKGRDIIYFCRTPARVPEVDTDTDAGRLKFARMIFDLRPYLREGKLFCETFSQYAFIRDFKP